jgi:hypothetical protein
MPDCPPTSPTPATPTPTTRRCATLTAKASPSWAPTWAALSSPSLAPMLARLPSSAPSSPARPRVRQQPASGMASFPSPPHPALPKSSAHALSVPCSTDPRLGISPRGSARRRQPGADPPHQTSERSRRADRADREPRVPPHCPHRTAPASRAAGDRVFLAVEPADGRPTPARQGNQDRLASPVEIICPVWVMPSASSS